MPKKAKGRSVDPFKEKLNRLLWKATTKRQPREVIAAVLDVLKDYVVDWLADDEEWFRYQEWQEALERRTEHDSEGSQD